MQNVDPRQSLHKVASLRKKQTFFENQRHSLGYVQAMSPFDSKMCFLVPEIDIACTQPRVCLWFCNQARFFPQLHSFERRPVRDAQQYRRQPSNKVFPKKSTLDFVKYFFGFCHPSFSVGCGLSDEIGKNIFAERSFSSPCFLFLYWTRSVPEGQSMVFSPQP